MLSVCDVKRVAAVQYVINDVKRLAAVQYVINDVKRVLVSKCKHNSKKIYDRSHFIANAVEINNAEVLAIETCISLISPWKWAWSFN